MYCNNQVRLHNSTSAFQHRATSWEGISRLVKQNLNLDSRLCLYILPIISKQKWENLLLPVKQVNSLSTCKLVYVVGSRQPLLQTFLAGISCPAAGAFACTVNMVTCSIMHAEAAIQAARAVHVWWAGWNRLANVITVVNMCILRTSVFYGVSIGWSTYNFPSKNWHCDTNTTVCVHV